LISKSKQIANTANIIQVWSLGAIFRCKKTCFNYISKKSKTKFGINFLEEMSRFFAIRARFYTPSPRIFYLRKQFSAETMFFIGQIFTFLKKILYKHRNLIYLNNFHTFLGVQKAKFDSLSHFLKYMWQSCFEITITQ
jgi:hypothetical protein